MNGLDEFITQVCDRMAVSFFHVLWQGLLIAAIVSVIAKFLQSTTAKYWLHFFALCCLAGCFVMNAVLPRSTWELSQVRFSSATPAESSLAPFVPPKVPPTQESVSGDLVTGTSASRSESSLTPLVVQSEIASGEKSTTQLSHLANIKSWLVVIYALGVAAMIGRLALGSWCGRRVYRRSQAVLDEHLLTEVGRRAKQLGLQALPALRRCSDCAVPVVLGLLRPTILLPTAMLNGMTIDQVSALLAHELVHLRRLDLWTVLAQRAIECVLFFHPATWWLSHQTNRYREQSCDDLVVAQGCSRAQYVDALLKMAELCLAPPKMGQAVALAADGHAPSEFRSRILRLLGEPEVNRRVQNVPLLFCLALAILSTSIGPAWIYAQQPVRPAQVAAVPQGSWPQFGGNSHRNNVLDGKSVETWSRETGENIERVLSLGDSSYFAPVIDAGRIIYGTLHWTQEGKDIPCLEAVDRQTGKLLWRYESPRLESGNQHDWPGFGMSSTPAVEQDDIYFLSNRCEVLCLDAKTGQPTWKTDLIANLGVTPCKMQTSSPTVVGDLVLIGTSHGRDPTSNDFNGAAPSFIALDKTTGRVVWQDNSPGNNVLHGQWSSPAYGVFAGVPQAIFAGGDGWLYSFDFRDIQQGRSNLIWKFDCNPKRSKWQRSGAGNRNNLIATPVIYEDRIYIATGQNPEHGEGPGILWCIDPTKRGDVSSELVFHGTYRLQPNDILGFKVDGLIEPKPDLNDLWIPTSAYQIPVQNDGTAALPLIEPIRVAGKTVEEAKALVAQAYLEAGVLKESELMAVHVVVQEIHEPGLGEKRHSATTFDRIQAAKEEDWVQPNPNSAAMWSYASFDQNSNGEIETEEQMHRTINSVAIREGLLVVSDMAGILHCLDAETGKVCWTHDLYAGSYSTPLIVGDRIYVGDEDGEVLIMALAREKKFIDEVLMPESISGPLVSDGQSLFIPSRSHLTVVTSGKALPADRSNALQEIPRYQRWQLQYQFSDVDSYAKELDAFGIELGCIGGGIPGIDYVSQLAGPNWRHRSAPKPTSEDRLYFIFDPASPHERFARKILAKAGVKTKYRRVLEFYPEELEAKLAALEENYFRSHGYSDVSEVERTTFESRPTESGFEFVVAEQVYRR